MNALDNVVIAPSDWTVVTLVSQIARETFNFHPAYQRRMAWRDDRQSRLIESLALGVPIPPILLAAEGPGRFHVIDGKQRLLALAHFCVPQAIDAEPLRLTSLPILTNLNGMTYEDIQNDPQLEEFRRRIEMAVIRTDVVRNWQPHDDALFFMFHRINSESVKLSPQELRVSLNPGPLLERLDEFTRVSPVFVEVYGFDSPDFRMRDVEVVTRYIAFRTYLREYSGNMKGWLDRTTKDLNNRWEELSNDIESKLTEFENAHRTALEVFGPRQVFRRWRNEDNIFDALNRALSDCVLFYFSNPNYAAAAIRNRDAVVEATKQLTLQDPRFVQSITQTTKSIENTHFRLVRWGERFADSAGIDVQTPRLVENRIVA